MLLTSQNTKPVFLDAVLVDCDQSGWKFGAGCRSVTQPEYLVAKFEYIKSNDTYKCPQGEILKTTGRWHKKSGGTEQSGYQFKK